MGLPAFSGQHIFRCFVDLLAFFAFFAFGAFFAFFAFFTGRSGFAFFAFFAFFTGRSRFAFFAFFAFFSLLAFWPFGCCSGVASKLTCRYDLHETAR